MALSFLEEQPATNAIGVFNLKTLLKAQGWTVPRSSDGTTYNSSGDQITTGAAGANGMDNNGAWFELLSRDGIVSMTIQRGTAGATNNYRIKIARVPFTAGSPGATQTPATPSVNDESTILGSGSDAAPAFQALIGAAGTTRIKAAADSVTADFYYAGLPNGGGNPNTALVCTGFDQGDSPDAFPYAIYSTNASHFLHTSMVGTGFRTFLPGGGGLPVTGTPIIFRTAGSTIVPVGAAADPITGEFGVTKVPIARAGGDELGVCWKGFSKIMRWVDVAGHATGDTYTLDSTKDLIIFRDVCLVWNGTTPTNGVASTDRTATDNAALTMTPVAVGTGGDSTGPVVDNWVASPIGETDPITFDVTDNLDELALVVIHASFGDVREMVYDGLAFTPGYNAASSATPIANGFTFSVERDAGWRATTTIKVTATDEDGNITNEEEALTGPTDAPPVVDNYNPPPGPIATDEAVSFDVTVTDDFDFDEILVFVQYSDRTEFAAIDGTFDAKYEDASTRTPISGGYTYELIPNDGWLGPFTLFVLAKDDVGQGVNESESWTAPLTGSVDGTAPTIGNFSPPVGSTIEAGQSVGFDVTDNSSLFRRIIVTARYDRTGVEEVVHDGDSFVGHYQTVSARSIIAGGWAYTVLRHGGWPSSPTFRIFAIDQGGNEAT